jgi:tripartite-type tricarboxylate transporter receptor subunit TctC
MSGRLNCIGAVLFSLLLIVAPQRGFADEYYAGKTIEMLIGADVGGSYDIYARLVARHLPRFVPGGPIMVARSVPGGGGAIGAAHAFTKMAKDGTAIGALMPGAILGGLVGEKVSSLFDPMLFNFIGTADRGTRVCLTRTSAPVKSYEDALRQPAVMATSQARGASRDYAALHRNATGTKFVLNSAYEDAVEIMDAMDRSEATGLCGLDYATLKARKPEWLRDGRVNILVQDALKPEPELTAMGVPTIWPFISNDFDRRAVEVVLSQPLFNRAYVLPPGVPDEPVAILRKAFMALMEDPLFLADAAMARVSISPGTGEELQEAITRICASPKDVMMRAKQIVQP